MRISDLDEIERRIAKPESREAFGLDELDRRKVSDNVVLGLIADVRTERAENATLRAAAERAREACQEMSTHIEDQALSPMCGPWWKEMRDEYRTVLAELSRALSPKSRRTTRRLHR